MLPARYRFAHQYCVCLPDAIAQRFADATQVGVFHVTFKVDPRSKQAISSLEGAELYDWLEAKMGDEFTSSR